MAAKRHRAGKSHPFRVPACGEGHQLAHCEQLLSSLNSPIGVAFHRLTCEHLSIFPVHFALGSYLLLLPRVSMGKKNRGETRIGRHGEELCSISIFWTPYFVACLDPTRGGGGGFEGPEAGGEDGDQNNLVLRVLCKENNHSGLMVAERVRRSTWGTFQAAAIL